MIEQDQQPQENGSPESPRDMRRFGQNTTQGNMSDKETEEVEHERDSEKWGQLPSYMQSIQTRGGQPDVPERYRRYRDAFLKQSQNKKSDEK